MSAPQPPRTSSTDLINSFPEILSSPDGPPKKYIVHRAVGSGISGTAFLVSRVSDNTKFIAKLTDLKALSEKKRSYARSEVRCLENCKHFAIIGHVENSEQADDKLLLIMELADAGDLGRQIKHRARLTDGNGQPNYFREHEVAFLFLQVTLAVDYMHRKGILHRDIKGANVFLMSIGIVKLGDLGFSQTYEDTVSNEVGRTFCGTPYYLAPELWRRFRYSKKADVWSLGVLLYEIAALRRPFVGGTMHALFENVVNLRYEPLPDVYGDNLKDLVKMILVFDPHLRPDTSAILRTVFMQYVMDQFIRTINASTTITEEDRRQILCNVQESRNAAIAAASAPPPPTDGVKGVIISGLLHKFSTSGWRQRFLVFDGMYLTISAVEQQITDTKNVPIRTVQGAFPTSPPDVGGRTGCFSLVLEAERGTRVFFQAETAAEALRWVNCINDALEDIAEREATANPPPEPANEPIFEPPRSDAETSTWNPVSANASSPVAARPPGALPVESSQTP